MRGCRIRFVWLLLPPIDEKPPPNVPAPPASNALSAQDGAKLRGQLIQSTLAADRLDGHPRLKLQGIYCFRVVIIALLRQPTPKLTYCVVQILGSIIDIPGRHEYPEVVRFEIEEQNLPSYFAGGGPPQHQQRG
jgi:hypothetical protein